LERPKGSALLSCEYLKHFGDQNEALLEAKKVLRKRFNPSSAGSCDVIKRFARAGNGE
jgi:hypothetical protein